MRSERISVGHPVDVVLGTVYSTHEDILIPGKVALVWERRYSTVLLGLQPTSVGPGWTTRYFATLTPENNEYQFFTPEGDIEIFADPEGTVDRGGIIRNLGTFQELVKSGNRYMVTRWDVDTGIIEHYIFEQGRKGEALPLARIEDVTGQGLDMLRDEAGRLIGIRQQLEGRTLRLGYNVQGRIATVTFVARTGEQQALATYEYDSEGRLITAYDALNNPERYEYDATGRMTREMARDGGVFSFRYDSNGRCVRTSGLDHYDEKTLRYFDAIRFTEVTNSYGQTTRYQYLPDGQVTSIWDPLGNETKTEYDEYGRVITEISPSTATTRYEYDQHGNRSKIVNPLGNIFVLIFNTAHQVLELTDPHGNGWKREYDARNRLVATVDADGARWLIRYDADGNPVEVTDPRGAHRTQRYVNGVLVETTDWKGNVTQLETDFLGRVVRRVGPLGKTLTFTYDLLGNPVRVILPDGNLIEASYNGGSNLVRLVDPRRSTTQYRYGPCRRLLQRIDPNGNIVKYVWGTEPGRLEQVINEKDEVYTILYDAAGRVNKEVSFDGREYFFEHNGDGWCTAVTNANGEVIRIRRDLEGRILEQQLSDGGFATYTYNKLGLVIEAVNQDIAIRVERDAIGRVLKEVQGEYWVQSNLDAAGYRTRMETSLGYFVDYEIDPNGDPTRIATMNNRVLEFQWDAARREILRSLPGNQSLEQRYDASDRLVEQRVGLRGALRPPTRSPAIRDNEALIRRFYVRDVAGIPVKIEDNHWGTTDYEYDPAGQLVRAFRSRGLSELFDYDVTGNITRIRSEGEINRNEALVYGSGNRLVEKAETTYEYDPQGRQVKKTESGREGKPIVWTYIWDTLDQLRAVLRSDGQVWEYKYDAFGRRFEKKGPNHTIRFVWDGDVLVHEIKEEDDQWTGWIFSLSDFTPLAKTEGWAFYSVITDHLGTPQEMIDTRGRIVWRHHRRAYGGELASETSGAENPIRFQGQYYDAESGLCYNRFRYYDPECGRFIQQDPIGLVGSNNLYHYAPNPTAWLDPFGLAECHESGDRGRRKAQKDLEDSGHTIVAEEVTMVVNGERIRADFVTEKGGRLYVFEVKNGTGRLTENQTNSGVFNISNPANQNGEIRTSGGSSPPGTRAEFTVATNNRPAVGNKGDTKNATFAVLQYDGTPGSRVQ